MNFLLNLFDLLVLLCVLLWPTPSVCVDICTRKADADCGSKNPTNACKTCQNSDTFCAECSRGFFKASVDEDLCLPCSLIPNCAFCADLQGCQQCKDNRPKITNTCGLQVCGQLPEPITTSPSASPTTMPSATPSAAPSAAPTLAPTTIEEFFEAATSGYFSGEATSFGDILDDNFEACIDRYGCGDKNFFFQAFGMCDDGANVIVESVDTQINDNISFAMARYTICCESSIVGTFWIRLSSYSEQELSTGLYTKAVYFYTDGTDRESFEFLFFM